MKGIVFGSNMRESHCTFPKKPASRILEIVFKNENISPRDMQSPRGEIPMTRPALKTARTTLHRSRKGGWSDAGDHRVSSVAWQPVCGDCPLLCHLRGMVTLNTIHLYFQQQ